MYPKLFIENFWRGEEREEVFICMPIDNDGKFYKKLKEIIEPAIRNIKLEPKIAGSERNEITQEFIDGILNAKILIFDLSNDPDFNNKMNGNVLYELGLATSVRNPSDIVLIREENLSGIKDIPFDIRTLPIYFNCPNDILSLEDKLNKAIQQKDWQKHKLLSIAHQSLDVAGFSILLDRFSAVKDQVYEHELGEREKLSMLRLIDLGVVHSWSNKWRKTECGSLFEFSYCLTKFGEELIKYIQELSRRSLKE